MKCNLILRIFSFIIIASSLCSTLNVEKVYAQETWEEITTAAEFNGIRNDLSGNYRLMSDINLSGYSNWVPIGSAGTPFTGQLDGNGKVIRNLSITNTTTTNQGLFSVIDTTGKVKNLTIENANITAGDNTGILAGTNSGEITATSTAGIISGNKNIGGLVGINTGSITNSASISDVSGYDQLGGLCGSNSGTVTNSYSASQVSPALLNTYLQFDGVDDYISIPNQSYYLTDTFTLEAWFQWDETDRTDVDFIVGKGVEQFEIHTGGNAKENGIRFIPAERTKTIYLDDRAYQDAYNVIQTGWFHVAAVWDFKEIRDVDLDGDQDRVYTAQIYINGVAQDIWQKQGGTFVNVGKISEIQFEDPDTNPNAANSYDFYIGKRSDGSFPFKGKISDVRFWNIARTAQQIAEDKHKQLDGTEGGLIGYWKLDETAASGSTAQDSTTHDNDGTIYGATRVSSTPTNVGGLIGVNTGTISDSYYDQDVSTQIDTGKGIPKTTLEMKTVSTFSSWVPANVWNLSAGSYPSFIEYTLTYSAGANGQLSGITTQKVRPGGYGSSVTANPNSGYGFINWSDAVTTATRTDINISGNLTVAANFADITSPTITDVSSLLTDGAYTIGQEVPITVSFSEAVTVTGTPQLTLETGLTDQTINYASGSGSSVLTFTYTVQAGDNSVDLDYTATTALITNGGTIQDAANNNATLTLASPGAAGSLGYNKAIVIDTASPNTTITANPTNPSSSASADFSFSGADGSGTGVAGYQCQLDGSGFTACSSPKNYPSLSDGSHTFRVQAVDSVGNVDPTPAEYTWVVDTAAPDTAILTQPSNPTNSTSANFTFSGEDTGGTGVTGYQCQLDGAAFTTCSSPKDYTGLADGSHTFQVRAVDSATNVDPTPAAYSWVVDSTGPTTTITAQPSNPTNSTSASFSFSGEDGSGTGAASFECQVDGLGFEDCGSPKSYSVLADGSHTFQVRTVDTVGNVDPTPAEYTWVVDTTLPDTTITANPTNPSSSSSASFSLSGADGSGTGVAGYQCQLDGDGFTDCASPITLTGLADGSHTFQVQAVDTVGNVDPTPAEYSWVVDTAAPNTAITDNPTNPSNSSSASFTFSGEDSGGTGVTGYQCQLDGAAFTTCSNPKDYTGLADGSHTFQVRAVDSATNVDPTPAAYTWVVDSTGPTTTITAQPSNPTNSTSASFSFSGEDTGGTGVTGYQCQLDGSGFTACFSPKDYLSLSDGSHTFQVRAVDGADTVDSSPASFTWVVDTVPPTVVMNSSATDPTNSAPIPVTVQFSKSVTGFTSDDITPQNGTITNFLTVDDSTFSFDLTPSGQGLVTADIAASAATDAAGNDNTPADQFSRTYDSIGPTVTINQADGQADPTNSSPVNFSVIFNESVTGFNSEDVTLSGTAGATTAAISGSGSIYTVAVSGMTTSGTVIAAINPGGTQDAATNSNAASTSDDNSVTFTFDTTTELTSSVNPAIFGQTITFTANVTSASQTPTGTVELREGTTPIGSAALSGGTASFSIATLSLGTHSITASYSGSVDHNASQSAPVEQVIGLANTTTVIATSGSPAGLHGSVTFTATVAADPPGVGTPTGTVEFFDGAASLGTATLDAGGQASFTTNDLVTGTHIITAVYAGDGNFNASTSADLSQVIEDSPVVLFVNTVADTGDGQLDENERTSAAITELQVTFNKPMNANTAADGANYSLESADSTVFSIDQIAYSTDTNTATLKINAGAALPDGQYALTAKGVVEDTLGTPLGEDFKRTFMVDSGTPQTMSVVTIQNDTPLTNGATINTSFSSLEISFSEDVNNAGGGADADDVTNPFNYLLLQAGANTLYDTTSCQAFASNGNLPLVDDIRIPTGAVTYTNHAGEGPFVAKVQINSGAELPNGAYRLLICGTTSIVDLAGNPLGNGSDKAVSFSILVGNEIKTNPATGFAPNLVTLLPDQPSEKAYNDLGKLWVEIPSMKMKAAITGVPLAEQGWDVTWLNQQVGWLEGTAYPTWDGNTVLTAHAYTADGIAGPFANLKGMQYGQTIIIHLADKKYTYAVRDNLTIRPSDTYWLTKHDEKDWITLITCQQYDEKLKEYRYRQVVRAVLINVE